MKVRRIQKEYRCASACQQQRNRRADNQALDDAGASFAVIADGERNDVNKLSEADGEQQHTTSQGYQRNLN